MDSDSFVRAQSLLSSLLVQLEFVHFIAMWLVGDAILKYLHASL